MTRKHPRLGSLKPRVGTLNPRLASPPKRKLGIYYTPEYLRWRAEVIRRAGNACQGQQHDPGKPRSGIRLIADHIVEIADGGAEFDPANGQALCDACHGSKTAQARVARYRAP